MNQYNQEIPLMQDEISWYSKVLLKGVAGSYRGHKKNKPIPRRIGFWSSGGGSAHDRKIAGIPEKLICTVVLEGVR
jgi:hypothetical protein